ncbi:MAG: uracil-DNA glycosylase [Gemmataceae bacterium]
MALSSLQTFNAEITSCEKCPRLVEWRETVAQEKRASFRDQEYWGRPLPGFGDPNARVLVCGLAPAAHGANRTGRVFTGDRSGDWLFASLHRTGFANQPTCQHRDDGLELSNCYVTCCVRCAPPDNKPTTTERDNCLEFLARELAILEEVTIMVCLGGFAWDSVVRILRQQGHVVRPKPKFQHAAECEVGPYVLLGSYHPSQQNTFTGRLTERMLDEVFQRAVQLAE